MEVCSATNVSKAEVDAAAPSARAGPDRAPNSSSSVQAVFQIESALARINFTSLSSCAAFRSATRLRYKDTLELSRVFAAVRFGATMQNLIRMVSFASVA